MNAPRYFATQAEAERAAELLGYLQHNAAVGTNWVLRVLSTCNSDRPAEPVGGGNAPHSQSAAIFGLQKKENDQ